MNEVYKSISQGLREAIDHAKGKPVKAVVHRPEFINVQTVRKKVGMTQAEFAASFGISLGTLRHWERGDRAPRGPALVLLNVVAKEPTAVLKALLKNEPGKSLHQTRQKAAPR